MVMSGDLNAGRSHNIKDDNSSCARLEESKYLETTLMDQNSIQEEIRRRSKSGNASYHLVQNILSFSLLIKNIKIYRTIILPIVLHGCEISLLTLMGECRLRVFEYRVLRGRFGSRTDEVTGKWRELHNEELNYLYSSPNIVRVVKLRTIRRAVQIVRTGERCIQGFGGETLGKETTWETPA